MAILPGVVILNCWDRFCTLGRAPLTKETLPDFREWCRVIQHPRVFRKFMGCQRTPGKWGVTHLLLQCLLETSNEGEKLVLERESTTSLLISRISDRRFSSGQEAKFIYATRAMREHQFCGVLTTPRGRSLLLLDLFFG